MAWTWVCPARAEAFGATQGQVAQEERSVCVSNDMTVGIVTPNLSRVEILASFMPPNGIFNKVVKIQTTNHVITFSENALLIDDKRKSYLTYSFIGTRKASKYKVIIELSANGRVEFISNGNLAISYDLGDWQEERVKGVYFGDFYSNKYIDYYSFIVSDAIIPFSTTIKEVSNLEITTDWTKNDDGTYQTSEVGKTITVDVGDDCASDGKVVLYKIPYLDCVSDGGNIKSINVKNDSADFDVEVEKSNAIGFIAGKTTFTTKE